MASPFFIQVFAASEGTPSTAAGVALQRQPRPSQGVPGRPLMADRWATRFSSRIATLMTIDLSIPSGCSKSDQRATNERTAMI